MENNKKLGQEPAFPTEIDHENEEMKSVYQVSNSVALYPGMSKRFYAACSAMQGLLSNGVITKHFESVNLNVNEAPKFSQLSIIAIIETSYRLADELLRKEHL